MRFGRQDLSDAYDAAKNLIIKHRMLRLCQYEVVPEGNQLTICNVWRIVRAPDMHVRTYEKCLQSGAWQEVSRLEGWPVIPFWPIAKTTSLHWWESIVERAVTKALWAVGYSELRSDQGAHLDKEPAKKEMQPWQISQIMCARYVRMLKDESSLVAAKALRAAFYQHIYEKDLASALLSVDYKYIRFHQYLGFARHRDSVLRVAREHRNLLCLLPYISPLKWGRSDLFSRKVWVRDGRKFTPIDRLPLKASKPEFAEHRFFQTLGMRSRDLRSCPSSSAWRWLTRAKSSVVTAWTQSDCNWQFAEVLATAQGNLPIPAVVLVHLLRYSEASRIGDFLACQVETDQLAHEVSIKLVRIFIAHCAKKWKAEGFAALRRWLKEREEADFRPVLDYLREQLHRQEPARQGQLGRLEQRAADQAALVTAARALPVPSAIALKRAVGCAAATGAGKAPRPTRCHQRRLVPGRAELAAAADVGHRKHAAFFQPLRAEVIHVVGHHRHFKTAVAVQQRGRVAVLRQPAAEKTRDTHPGRVL